MLTFTIAAGLALASSPLRRTTQLHRAPSLSMYNGGGGGGGGGYRGDEYIYPGDVDDRFGRGGGGPTLGDERLESVKACSITGIVGTAVASPILVSILSKGGSAPLQLGLLFVTTFLFGAVYRCAVRSDGNAQLKLGAVAAFAIVRAVAAVPASASSWSPVVQADFLGQLWIGVAAFGHAAVAYEAAVDGGYAFPLEGYSRALDAEFSRDRGDGDGYGGGREYGNDGYGGYDGYGDNNPSRYGDGRGRSYGTQGDFYGNNRGGNLGGGSYGNDRDRFG